MSLFRPLKYIKNATESEVRTQTMKIGQVKNYHIKPDKTLDIFIVKLLNLILFK